jgi:hypothetical protein
MLRIASIKKSYVHINDDDGNIIAVHLKSFIKTCPDEDSYTGKIKKKNTSQCLTNSPAFPARIYGVGNGNDNKPQNKIVFVFRESTYKQFTLTTTTTTTTTTIIIILIIMSLTPIKKY